MTKWQRRARLVVAVFALAFLVIVALAIKRKAPVPAPASVGRTDPNSVIESSGGQMVRFNRTREDVSIEYEKQLTYADGSTKLLGAKITTDERGGGRSFTVTGKEALVGKDESTFNLNGDVHLTASDGFQARTEHATYTDHDGMVHAPGPVEFSRNRMSGSGIGMDYDKNLDVLTLLDQAVVRVAPDESGAGGADVTAGTATFARQEKQVRFERAVKVERGGQTIEGEHAVAYLADDEQRIQTFELRGGSSVTTTNAEPGALQSLTGQDMNIKYGPDGQAIEHVLIVGQAAIRMAGAAGKAGRLISASTLDIGLAPDGSTPRALVGRDGVQLTFPAEQGTPARTIRSTSLDATGVQGQGLTNAVFTGAVEFREKGQTIDRAAKSEVLELALQPGMTAIDEAKFLRAVRFEEGTMTASAANARYLLGKGLLELSGSEPPNPRPRVINEQIAVEATRIDVGLEGPTMKASGDVKSVLQPAKQAPGTEGSSKGDTKLPSMLNQNQPVNVVGRDLDYDGPASKAVYKGASKLWQMDTSIQADSIAIDQESGDLDASGAVATATMLEQTDQVKKTKERVRSIGRSKDFNYQESTRRATYTGDAHISGPQGDMTAARIELYLRPSGNEVDRAEAFESVTLREQNRKTTGARLTYTAADERYVVTGKPVKITEQCGRETTGGTLTFIKATDTISVDGKGVRSQTSGGTQCS